MNRMYRLLAHGYFPKELPPCFTTKAFAKYINKTGRTISPSKIWTRPGSLVLQQSTQSRRRLQIVNPHSSIALSRLISDNYQDIAQKYHNKEDNCSIPAFNRKTKYQRAIRPYAIGKQYTNRKILLRSKYPHVLKLDINSYYKSIYTHSIPWAFVGKPVAKAAAKRRGKLNHYSEYLDEWVRNGQDGQTIGIPVGPDSSFIISEVIQSYITKELEQKGILKSGGYVRYYDDYEIGLESETDREKIIYGFEQIISEFELTPNTSKTKLVSGFDGIESGWV